MSSQQWSQAASTLEASTKFNLDAAINATFFDRQLAFDRDPSRRKAAFCTRRAGKTDLIPKRLLKRAAAQPESIRVFLAITRPRARELIWRPLELVDEKYKLGCDFNTTTGTVTLPNHAVIRLRGADDKKESEKGRGDKLHEVDIDEAQIFPPEVLKNMIDDVYGPTLEDVGGSINVYGTPGIVCAGKWFEMTRPDVEQREPGWSVHQWGVLDNPFMAHMKERLPQLKLERRWADDNPTYMREWLGQWVNDNSALFYKFDPTRNVHDMSEAEMLGGEWQHVLGWDIGLRDDMALVAWAFHPRSPDLYEAFSWKRNGVTSEEVVKQVKELESRGYNFITKVADTGGLGALVVEEVGKRFEMHFEAAKKTEKAAHVELFNDDMLTGHVKLKRGSVYANEIAVLPKDPDAPPHKPASEDPRFPNHCGDAGLYGWRHAQQYMHKPKEPPPPPLNSPEWHAKVQAEQQAEIEEDFEAGLEKNKQDQREEWENNQWL